MTAALTALSDELEAAYDAFDSDRNGRTREACRALRQALAFSRGFSYSFTPPEPEVSAADLAAFADAMADYTAAYDHDSAEYEGAEADRAWRRRTLLLEGAELFRHAGLELAA
jgi:hypothetical protein